MFPEVRGDWGQLAGDDFYPPGQGRDLPATSGSTPAPKPMMPASSLWCGRCQPYRTFSLPSSMPVSSWKDHFSQAVFADFPQSPWLVLHSFHCITSSLLAGWVLKDVFYKGQVPTVICHHQLLETPRKPRNDTTSATWIGSQLAAMLFPVHTTPPFTQNLWILVSLTALSEIAINKVLSMLRFTMYIFCSGLSGAICAAFHWKETCHG